jgi:hypothetical protein
MPVFLARRKLDHTAWMNFLDWSIFALYPTTARRHDQGLS